MVCPLELFWDLGNVLLGHLPEVPFGHQACESLSWGRAEQGPGHRFWADSWLRGTGDIMALAEPSLPGP